MEVLVIMKKTLQHIKDRMEPYAEKLRTIGIKTEWFPSTDSYSSMYTLSIDKNDIEVGYITCYKPKNELIVCFSIKTIISEYRTITFSNHSVMSYTLSHYKSFNENEFNQVFDWCNEIVKYVKEFRQKENELKIRNDF